MQSTLAGQIGQDDVNVRGVAVDINMLANLPGGDGLPVSFSVRRILEAADVGEAVAHLKSARFAQTMHHLIGDRGRVVSVETWDNNVLVLDMYDGDYAMLANHSLGEGTPKTFEMTAQMGGGSHGFTMERLALGIELLSAHTEGVTLKSSPEMFKTRPILVHPGEPMGRTLIYTVAKIPKEGSPALHGTPNSPNVFGHARFTLS